VRVVHAKGNGDDTIVAETAAAVGRGERVSVVTADRFLQSRVQGAGAIVLGPSWLWDQLD
jgi:predicted RNA-binding protein with PIN domain